MRGGTSEPQGQSAKPEENRKPEISTGHLHTSLLIARSTIGAIMTTLTQQARTELLSARAVRRFPSIPMSYWALINHAERLIGAALRKAVQA